MKIAVTSEDGEVFQHFGHTPGFTLFETDGKNILSETELSSGETGHGALAGLLAEKNVDLLICGGIGGGAVQALARRRNDRNAVADLREEGLATPGVGFIDDQAH